MKEIRLDGRVVVVKGEGEGLGKEYELIFDESGE
jgi:hypothetical protein